LEIHRADQMDGPYKIVGRTNGSQYGIYVDGGLTPKQTYYYKARIVKSDGRVGKFTETQAATTQTPTVTWHWIRQGTEAKINYVYINWSSWYDVDYAQVLRATDVGGPYVAVDTLVMNTCYQAAVPSAKQPYYYRLMPVKNGVEGKAIEPVMVYFP